MRRTVWAAPIEVRLTLALMLGLGLVHLLIAVILLAGGGTPRVFVFPAAALLFGMLVSAGVLLRMPSSRIAAYVVIVLLALIHLLAALGGGLWFVKVFSWLAAAGYVYAGVLFGSGPFRRYLTGERA